MAFLSPLLLLGAFAIAIPIVLHLRRRQDPVRVEFPALRLLKRNKHRTETRLRVRRWVLLALRCLLLLALAVALARPLLKPPSPDGGPDPVGGPVGEGVALAVVVDNGPNAAYQRRNQSRLDAARELAGVLLDKLPRETPVVLADRATTGGATAVEPAAAAARVERMRLSDAARPLGAVVRDAVTRLAETPAARREAYVFTDMSRGAWDEDTRRVVAAVLQEHPGLRLRLVDVGAPEPRNAAVQAITQPSELLATGEPLAITASIHLVGEWREPLGVQLWVNGPAGPVKRDERLVEPADAEAVDFTLAGLEDGFATGFVRVVAGDSAPADDVRHFAVEVRQPRRVLVVAPRERDAVFFRSAIDPPVAGPDSARRFETRVIAYDAWPRQSLVDYDAVVLCDPPPMIERRQGWSRLYGVASQGGGIGFFLGREATLDAFNSTEAQALLPAALLYRSRDQTYLRPTGFSHPAIKPLAPYAEAIPWPAFPVYQRWETDKLADGATVVARYADGAPAILERGVGRGRVVMMTTSVSDRRDNPDAWNLLPTGEDPWPFVLLANSLADYLTGASETRLSFLAGEPVVAPSPRGLESPGYVLRSPSGDAVRQTVPPGATELTISSANAPGAYLLETGSEVARRFVVNLDPSAGRLDRVPTAELAESLGEQRVEVLTGREAVAQAVDLGRVGRELYGFVLLLAAAALVGEQWVSSSFYRGAKE